MSSFFYRRDRKLRLDSRVIDGLARAAAKQEISGGQLAEEVLFRHLQSLGEIALDAELLPEQRGGVREGSGRPRQDEKRAPTRP